MQMNSKCLRRLFGAVVILFVVGIVLPGYATAKSPTGKPVTIVGTTETAGPQVDTLGIQFEGGYALAIKEINDGKKSDQAYIAENVKAPDGLSF